MHELAIAYNIAELAMDAANGCRVRCVTVEIGKLSGVSPEAIAFCFPEVARGTALETAHLAIREIEGLARCKACGCVFATPSMLIVCPCGSMELERLSGEELNIKSIELDEVD